MTPIVFVWFPGGPEDQLSVNCWLPPHFAWLQGHTCKHALWQRLYVGLLTDIKPVICYNAHILVIRILSLSCKEIQQKVYGAWFYFTRNSLLSHIELTRRLELLGFSPAHSEIASAAADLPPPPVHIFGAAARAVIALRLHTCPKANIFSISLVQASLIPHINALQLRSLP